jgi:membrane protein DedA with SNARE-associated domain
MYPEGWSRARYIRYVAAKLMLAAYVVCGLVQLGLSFCWALLEDLGSASHCFKTGCILLLVALVIAIVEYNLRPEVKDDEPYY